MIKTIFLIMSVIAGFIIFLLGLKELRKQSFKENLLDTILSSILGMFQFTGVGIMLIGLFLMVICTLALMGM